MHNNLRLSFIPLFALAACASQPVETKKRIRNITTNSNDNNDFRNEILKNSMMKTHNIARTEVNVPPLFWDEGLVKDARIYAQKLAAEDIFEHDPQNHGGPPQGEISGKGQEAPLDMSKCLARG